MTRNELEKKFWELWWADQNEWERSKPWFPLKRPMQIPEEFLECLLICSEVKDPFVVEIGIMAGKQRRFWVELLGAEYLGIDSNPQAPADIHCQSSQEAVDAVLKLSNGRKPNIVFIDGDHSREAVNADWNTWKNAVESPGLICFHDIHHDHDPQTDGAARLWGRLVKHGQVPTIEIFHRVEYTPKAADDTLTQCGIGIVKL